MVKFISDIITVIHRGFDIVEAILIITNKNDINISKKSNEGNK